MKNQEFLKDKLIKFSFISILFTFLTLPLGYIIRTVISYNLDVKDVGIFYTLLGLIVLIHYYIDLGVSESIKYFLPKFWYEKKYNEYITIFFYAIFINLVSYIFVFFISLSSLNLINTYVKTDISDIFLIFIIFLIIFHFFNLLGNLILGFQDIFWFKFSEFLRMLSTLFFIIIFTLLGLKNIFFYAIGYILGGILGGIIITYIFLKKYKHTLIGKFNHKNELLKNFLKFSFGIMLGGQAMLILTQSDQQLVMFYLGAKDAGYYSNYIALFLLPLTIIGSINNFLSPIATELKTKNELEKLNLLINIIVKYFFILGIYIGISYAFLGKNIAYILFSEKFIKSGELLIFGSIGIPFLLVFVSLEKILLGLGHASYIAKTLRIGAIINLILNIFLIPKLGLVGAIIGTVIGILVQFILYFKKSLDYFKPNIDIFFYIKNIILSIILSIIFIYNNEIKSYIETFYTLIIIGIISIFLFIIVNIKEIKIFINIIRK